MIQINIFSKWDLDIYIQDKIFLYLDFDTLKKTRCFQSEYVKKTTEFSNINDATYNGNLNNMKWLLANNCLWNSITFKSAAYNGNLNNMKWLKANSCPWDKWTFIVITYNGNLNNMKWIKANGCSWNT